MIDGELMTAKSLEDVEPEANRPILVQIYARSSDGRNVVGVTTSIAYDSIVSIDETDAND